ncbi:NAD(P)/FAD-dependent oxidoreductase [Candidatus Altiarchaeota archaeon]
MAREVDVVIVGAGPAGMFAAHELIDKDLKVLIVDEGFDIKDRCCPMEKTGKCVDCQPCHIMCGVGGSGTFSDGTLNLRPDIGGNLEDYTHDQKKAEKLVKEVDDVFLEFGAPQEYYIPHEEAIAELKRRAASAGITFVEIPQRHIGTDKAPAIIESFASFLKEKKIEFLVKTKVEDLWIEGEVCKGIILEGGKKIKAKKTLVAPGRVGASWMDEVIHKHNILSRFGAIDVGVRVEVPAIIMEPVISINRDPKFHIRTKSYDDFVRTFCTNHEGFVVKEKYDSYIGVNGHSLSKGNSLNTNFAFLVQVNLTHPVENTISYGKSIAQLATTIGGGKPIIQRLGDLRRGRRSHPEGIERNPVKPTLHDTSPGDISMALPHRVVMNIVEGLEKLNEIIPGVASDSTLLYAPEIKFYASQVRVKQNLESKIKDLFAAGDGVGLSRDIVNASATGIIAGRGILHSLKHDGG